MVIGSFDLQRSVSEWFSLIPPDVWKMENGGRIDSCDIVGLDVVTLMITRLSRVFVSLEPSDPPQCKDVDDTVKGAVWLAEFKSVSRVQRSVRTEWNVVTGLPNRLIRTPSAYLPV
ncbi:hypothetical protein TNCV_2627581 [Trichonephila clavipes]|uniref:Uncharacterized protein n=1 Tax=Trichonephila clavipes TaxID=2585209 RepID=A0A8X6W781_TRICX|nr:hypothetical protein TNCV_2627581 [Trichonephila clavipes]